MNKYKEATCCKCLGAILVLEHDYSDDFYCNTCAWAKVGGVRLSNTPTEVQS